MIKIPSTKEILSILFSYLVNHYDHERFPDFEAVYQFILKEGEQTFRYYISVSKRKAQRKQGDGPFASFFRP